MSKCERCRNLKVCEFYDVNDEPGYEELGDEGCDMFSEKVEECKDCIIGKSLDYDVQESEVKSGYFNNNNITEYYNFCNKCGKDLRYLKK